MSDLKPIEAGCLAMIIKSVAGNEGTSVTVGNFIGYVDGFNQVTGPRWEIDKDVPTLHGNKCNHIGEKCLMRIDGHEPDEQDEQIKAKDHERAT